MTTDNGQTVVWFDGCGRDDVGQVGGKNASLGEMITRLTAQGITIPDGFATTAQLYWQFIDASRLRPVIQSLLDDYESGKQSLSETGSAIRKAIVEAKWPSDLADSIGEFYAALSAKHEQADIAVAVRSSATAEDLPDASFAGQQETFLNIRGRDALLDACRRCIASLFTDRAISYRETKGFSHLGVALSIGIQAMVRADKGSSGVLFSIDTETGFDRAAIINAAWGLGETVVQGTVDPDEYTVFKPFLQDRSLIPIIGKRLGAKARKMIYASTDDRTREVPTSAVERKSFVLSDEEILHLARWAVIIENHYGCPMDIEWAKDGNSGQLFVVQARPETVQARRDPSALNTYRIKSKGQIVATGLSVGDAIAVGKVCLIESADDIDRFVDGSILVTSTTDPDWVPVMKRAAGIITDHGGRTSHAAIVSRELGIPAVVGTGYATQNLHDEREITLSCAEGDEGRVYDGFAEYQAETISLDKLPETQTKVMLNLADPGAAFRWWRMPADGVGLVRMEFMIGNHIRVHPMALACFDELKDQSAKHRIEQLTAGYADRTDYFVDHLARGLGMIAAAFHPKPVIVRMSDFKTNEYARLAGGEQFEPQEENPMIGFRGASRYYSPAYRDGFELECRAIQKLRRDMGFDNVVVMVPFCRSPAEAREVLSVMSEFGLERGKDNLQIYVMCEIPANVVLARQFAKLFDGFSIGSNDLTQLTLGIDRDCEALAGLFDEQNDAVKWMIEHVINEANAAGSKIGLCGQAPSDYPEFAGFLVGCGIDSISVTPDSFVQVKSHVAAAEARISAKTSKRIHEV